jgi:hypothetical protein
MSDNYIFNPILGSENSVLNQEAKNGSLYFTTDTRKIYLDIDNKSKLPMGGNVGLFYGKMKLTSPPVEGQKEFEFNVIDDIVGNNVPGANILIPNENDLILNSDGCFYKVLSSYGVEPNITLSTEKLTIAGTSTSGGADSLSGMSVSRLRFDKGQTILYSSECPVSFAVKVTDDLGDALVGNVGTYDLYINSEKKLSGNVIGTTAEDVTDLTSMQKEEINTIDVGPYLFLGENIDVKISVTGINGGVITRAGSVSTTNMTLKWDYDETTVNVWNESIKAMTLRWSVSGNLEKTTHIIINDDKENEITITNSSTTTQTKELKFDELNLWHGAHKIEMYATTKLSGSEVATPSICKNIIVAKNNDLTPIISCGFFETDVTQYNTVKIPIIVYNPAANTNVVTLIENGSIRDEWPEVENCIQEFWSYTPITEGATVLTI